MAAWFNWEKILEEERRKQEIEARSLQNAQKESEARKEEAQKKDLRTRTVEMNRRRAEEDDAYAPAGVSREAYDALRDGSYTSAQSAAPKKRSTFAEDVAARQRAYELQPKVKTLFGTKPATVFDLLERPEDVTQPTLNLSNSSDYKTLMNRSQTRQQELLNRINKATANPVFDSDYLRNGSTQESVSQLRKDYQTEVQYYNQLKQNRAKALIKENTPAPDYSVMQNPGSTWTKEDVEAKAFYDGMMQKVKDGSYTKEDYDDIVFLLNNTSGPMKTWVQKTFDEVPKFDILSRTGELIGGAVNRTIGNIENAFSGMWANDVNSSAKRNQARKEWEAESGQTGGLYHPYRNSDGKLVTPPLEIMPAAGLLRKWNDASNAEQYPNGVQSTTESLYTKRADESYQRGSYGLSPAGQFVYNAGSAIAGALTDAGAAALTGASPNAMMALSAGGQAYQDALDEGKTTDEAFAYGAIWGGLVSAMNKVLGGIEITGANAKMPAWIQNAAKRVSQKPATSTAVKYIYNAMQEGGEEYLEEILEPVVRNIAFDENNEFQPFTQQALEAGLIGAISAGAINALELSGNYRTARAESQNRTVILANRASVDNASTAAQQRIDTAVQNAQLTGVDEVRQQAQLRDSHLDSSSKNVSTEPILAGQVTKIYKPYEGESPVQSESIPQKIIQVPNQAVERAKNEIIRANNQPEAGSVRKQLKKAYDTYFDQSGGSRKITVNGLSYKGEPYEVTLNKSAIDKVISDKNLTVQKIALFDILDEVIQNGVYVGSGAFDGANKKTKPTIRFDYFETPVNILNEPYIAAYDVEVFPAVNNYKTHRIIKKMDLIPTDSADTGPVPAAPESSSSPNQIIPQTLPDVKSTVKKEMYSGTTSDQYASGTDRWIAQKNEDAKNTARISDIVSYIEKKFDIPISTGNISQRNARGIYKGKDEAIRTRVSNALPTIAHELGHHLDNLFGLSNAPSIGETITNADQSFLNSYKDSEKPGEAVAEFVREYLSNKTAAQQKFPNFYNDFINSLDKKTLSDIDKVANMFNGYLSSDVNSRIQSSIVTRKQARNQRDWSNVLNNLYQKWIDSNYSIKRLTDNVRRLTGNNVQGAQDAYKLATNSLNAEARANFLITDSMADINGNYGLGPSLLEAISDISTSEQKDFSTYLVARHAIDWLTPDENGNTKRVFADDKINNIDEMRRIVQDMEREHPEFASSAQKVYEYQRALLKNWLVDTGLMSIETYNSLLEKYPNYVPFNRAVNDAKRGHVKSGFANQRAPVQRAKGSGLEILDPIESIVYNTSRFVKAATRNEVMQRVAEYADDVTGLGSFLERVPPDMVPKSVDVTGAKNNLFTMLSEEGLTDETISSILDQTLGGDRLTEFTPVANEKKGIVTVYRDGKPQYYQIHDKGLLESLSELSPEQLSGIYKISQTFMSPMKALTTGMNPFFGIGSNVWRDLRTAYVNSNQSNPVSFLGSYIRSYYDMLRNSDAYKEYRAMGGGNNSALTAERDLVKKVMREVQNRDAGKVRRAFDRLLHPISTIQDLSDAIETSNRLAEYTKTRDAGGDRQEAIYRADDITTNFKRAGKSGRKYNALVMYGNAALQGLDRVARNFTQGGKKATQTAMKLIIPAMLTTLFMKWWNRDDEEAYKNLSAYHKNNYYNLSTGDGRFVRIPKAREMDVLTSLIERLYERFAEEDEDAFYGFADYLLSQIVPPGIPTDYSDPGQIGHGLFSDTIAGPLVDIAANQDFKGSPIVSGMMEDLAPKKQYNERTSLPAVWLGQLFNMSPMQIDHIINSNTGVLGRLNKALLPSSIYSEGKWSTEGMDKTLGLKSQFVVDSVYSTDELNKFYDAYEAADQSYQYNPTDTEASRAYYAYKNKASYISQYRDAIEKSGLSEEGKRLARQKLNDNVSNFTVPTAGVYNLLDQVYAQSNDPAVYISPMSSKLTKTTGKKRYELQLSPDEYKAMQDEAEQLIMKRYQTILDHGITDTTAKALKDAQSAVKEQIRNKYKKQYSLKFREVKK